MHPFEVVGWSEIKKISEQALHVTKPMQLLKPRLASLTVRSSVCEVIPKRTSILPFSKALNRSDASNGTNRTGSLMRLPWKRPFPKIPAATARQRSTSKPSQYPLSLIVANPSLNVTPHTMEPLFRMVDRVLELSWLSIFDWLSNLYVTYPVAAATNNKNITFAQHGRHGFVSGA